MNVLDVGYLTADQAIAELAIEFSLCGAELLLRCSTTVRTASSGVHVMGTNDMKGLRLPSDLIRLNERKKLLVWAKGHVMPSYDPAIWRRDDFGYTMRYSDHGDRKPKFGWEMDHVDPTAPGGSDIATNPRPLHLYNNIGLGVVNALPKR